jgi:hypothetical protein
MQIEFLETKILENDLQTERNGLQFTRATWSNPYTLHGVLWDKRSVQISTNLYKIQKMPKGSISSQINKDKQQHANL